MFNRKKWYLLGNENGAGMLNVAIAAIAVAGGMLLLTNTSKTRSQMTLDTNQNNTIENIILDMRTTLASSESCKVSMNSPVGAFQEIGSYKPSSTTPVENNIFLTEISKITAKSTAREFLYKVVFLKKNLANKTEKEKVEFINIQKFETDTEITCSSFETDGVDNSIQAFCSSIGATFDTNTGKCDVSSIDPTQYTESLGRATCALLGGTYESATNFCSQINLPSAELTTSHLTLNQITLVGDGLKSGFKDMECPSNQIVTGFKKDGGVSCSVAVCPKIVTTSEGSSYKSALNSSGTAIECQCSRDRGSEINCGGSDPRSCNSYEVDDGCGSGNSCTINRGLFANTSCGNSLYKDETCIDPNCGELVYGKLDRPVVVTPPVVTPPVVTPPVVTNPRTCSGYIGPDMSLNRTNCCLQWLYKGFGTMRRKVRCTEPGRGRSGWECVNGNRVMSCAL